MILNLFWRDHVTCSINRLFEEPNSLEQIKSLNVSLVKDKPSKGNHYAPLNILDKVNNTNPLSLQTKTTRWVYASCPWKKARRPCWTSTKIMTSTYDSCSNNMKLPLKYLVGVKMIKLSQEAQYCFVPHQRPPLFVHLKRFVQEYHDEFVGQH